MSSAAKPIEIFKPGTFTSVDGQSIAFSAADLAEIAASYRPDSDPAPAVIGHPEMDDPAWAWAERLDVQGDRLCATLRDVEPTFGEAVKAGRYRRISASFYPRDHAANPSPGKLYLKHIGFLGAAAPAVKGLKPVHFSEAQNLGCITIETTTATPAQEQPMPDDAKKALEYAERDATLKAREDALATGETALKARSDAADKAAVTARHTANLAFAEAQIKAGKLAPAGKDGVVHIMDQLAAPAVLAFGEGATAKPALVLFQALFDGAVPIVNFGEHAKDDGARSGAGQDPKVIANKALAFAETQKKAGIIVSVAEAVRHVQKQGDA